ncbi:hypothetical protein K8S19_00510 [bacterium]|nr:hypothetical protein [bacterium]
MAEEGMITMNEFKTVVERFEDNQKKIIEVITHKFDNLETRMTRQENKSDSMMEQIAILHEGQTEMKAELKIAKKERNALNTGQMEVQAELKIAKKERNALNTGQMKMQAELKTAKKERSALNTGQMEMQAELKIAKKERNALNTGQMKMQAELETAKLERNALKAGQVSLGKGQQEIKAELKNSLKKRVTYQDFNKLEKRVVRLANKVA